MEKKIILLAVLMSAVLSSTAFAEVRWNQIADPDGVAATTEFTKKQYGLSENESFRNTRIAAMLTSLRKDWEQTLEIKNNRWTHERNQVLGPHPSDNEINVYYIVVSTLIVSAIVNLPEPWGIVVADSIRYFEEMLDQQNIEVQRNLTDIQSVPVAVGFSWQF